MAIRKPKLLTMKVSEFEKQTFNWLAQEQNISVAELIRSSLLVMPIDAQFRTVVKPNKKRIEVIKTVDPKLLRQVAAIGNNLNQLSRRVNEREQFDVRMSLYTINHKLEKILDAYQIY